MTRSKYDFFTFANPKNCLRMVLFVAVASIALLQNAHAAGGGSYDSGGYGSNTSKDRFAEVNEALGEKAYAQAIELLKVLEADTPKDADVQNLLGFSNRKLGNYEIAYTHYQMALEIDPEHIRAHEYLGELYLQTDRLADAELQLKRISELCGLFCKEKRMLRKAIEQYKADNA